MIKKFIAWTRLKIKINVTERVFYFREGEIWWASLGANNGHEEDGKNDNFERPVVVLKKFNQYVLWALPLTSQIKEGNRYYYKYELNGKQFSAVLSQLRLISSKRLLRRVANLSIIGLSPNALL